MGSLEKGPEVGSARLLSRRRTQRDHVGVEDPWGAQEGFDSHAAGAVQGQQQGLRVVDARARMAVIPSVPLISAQPLLGAEGDRLDPSLGQGLDRLTASPLAVVDPALPTRTEAA